ncbi:MAG: ribosome small subunit-dependent GTPase A [Proteobacteria bacterium]|nr:ribosome small subunit-dependent GTPase A [Pseudomonadota bacterium]
MVEHSCNTLSGRVISAHGRHYFVEPENISGLIDCVTKGRKHNVVVNDRVDFEFTSQGQGVITGIKTRTAVLYRCDAYRQKMLVANVDKVVVMAAVWPPLYESLLYRILLAVESAGLGVLILFNKVDLPESDTALPVMKYLESLGYPILKSSILDPLDSLLGELSGHTSFLIGQSGVGKSTLLNRLLPQAHIRTDEVSRALRSGRHTTTHSTLYHIDPETILIDSPGLQEFGLAHLSEEGLVQAFVEFRSFVGHCRFANCHHVTEPGCSIIEAVEQGHIRRQRHDLYVKLLSELACHSVAY